MSSFLTILKKAITSERYGQIWPTKSHSVIETKSFLILARTSPPILRDTDTHVSLRLAILFFQLKLFWVSFEIKLLATESLDDRKKRTYCRYRMNETWSNKKIRSFFSSLKRLTRPHFLISRARRTKDTKNERANVEESRH